ncbi:hypothetical protein SAMN02745824_3297 [Parasphingorhabdus marina DSM 22363]|uniref:Barstar (Barnase inhibitor) n=1 Tax=Parasphingorhabdus marina DSM 22363 TaxID=1123272 RepID=A0A1N6HHZ6_9SPHN|nr:hypothetical protein [Parasphingorhabdus marina]SIO19382.1 hypothetical protein SAMN02745824_3297 [Parasphingorhabdus marina DSM 22363]
MSEKDIYVIELDGTKLQSREDFFRDLSIATDLDLVPNLDALDEDLALQIPFCCGPFKVIWHRAESSDWSGYSEITKILGVLFFAQQRDPDHFIGLELVFDSEENQDASSFQAAYSSPGYVAERKKRANKLPDRFRLK